MDLIRDFKDPGREYSVLAFWFLNGELKKERLAWQIGQMVEKGVYGGFMHPRAYLKTPYLEDEWWDACLLYTSVRIHGDFHQNRSKYL